MNILITGAGLIGTHAARHAVDAGHKVVLFDLSPNREYIQKVVGKDKADVVAAELRQRAAELGDVVLQRGRTRGEEHCQRERGRSHDRDSSGSDPMGSKNAG